MKAPSFTLVFLLLVRLALPVGSAKIQVIKKDNKSVNGELLTVNPESLVVLIVSGEQISIPRDVIHHVTIKKKGWFLTGFILGGAVGNLLLHGRVHWSSVACELFMIGAVTGLLGGMVSRSIYHNKKYNFISKSSFQRTEMLHELKKYALLDH